MNSEELAYFKTKEDEKKLFGLGIGIAIFAIIWAILGIVAFIYSLVCFGKSGSSLDKIVGLLLAIFFGPLYFIYLIFNKSYCR